MLKAQSSKLKAQSSKLKAQGAKKDMMDEGRKTIVDLTSAPVNYLTI
jgi:hypothetical protein